MTLTPKVRCWIYGAIAAGALVATWSQNIRFFSGDGSHSLGAFISDSFDNAAAASISLDLSFILLAAFVLMAVEAKRLGIRHLWAYMLGSLLIAVSVAFPLFLIARELQLAALANGGGETPRP